MDPEGLPGEIADCKRSYAEDRGSGGSSPESGTALSSGTSAVSLGEAIARRAKQGMDSWCRLPAVEDQSRLTAASLSRVAWTPSWHEEEHTQNDSQSIQEGLVTTAKDLDLQQSGGQSCTFQLDFQASHLSPALPLLPANSGKLHSLSEDTFFHQTDLEFIALRGSPDISVAMPLRVSDAVHGGLPEVSQGWLADHPSLSQHPLAHGSYMGDVSSCCSLSQHTMSPASANGDAAQGEGLCTPPSPEADSQEGALKVTQEDDGSRSSGDVSAHLLLELLQSEVGKLSSSAASELSSAPESKSPTSPQADPAVKCGESRLEEESAAQKRDFSTSLENHKSSAETRECPLGAASLPCQRQARDLSNKVSSDPSVRAELSNVTLRSSHILEDEGANALRWQLRSEIETIRQSQLEPETTEKESGPPLPVSQSVTPNTASMGTESGRERTIIEVPTGVSGTEPTLSAGFSFERGHTERELSTSGNQTAVDGSFLASLSQPVSQSTPGVFLVHRRAAQPPIGQLSLIESSGEAYRGSSRPPLRVSVADRSAPGPGNSKLGTASLDGSGKIRALPSLSYMEKVGAWNANQTSGLTYLDNLALRRFSGASPKDPTFDAASDSLNRERSRQGSSRSPPPIPAPEVQPPAAPPRGQRAGSHSSDDPAAGGTGRQTSDADFSPLPGNSEGPKVSESRGTQGHLGESRPERAESGGGAAEIQPPPCVSLGQFNDVSSNRDLSFTMASSQDSHYGHLKPTASTAVSSVVSLDVDNYAPYWTTNPSSPIKERELNIEERIPMYLHNLGIDQSPSTILTPFVPRGPIREPEFSPTDLCTIKGSTGTPTKSAQPSEGGSHGKGAFSRSSVQSLGSSTSNPLSTDSLQPNVPLFKPTEASSSLDGPHSRRSLCTAFNPQDDPPETLKPSVEKTQRDGLLPGQDAQPHLGNADDGPMSSRLQELPEKVQANEVIGGAESAEPCEEAESSRLDRRNDSFVGSKTLQEIRKLLGRAESIVSGRSSPSSTPGSAEVSENSLLGERGKLEDFQDSFTSSVGHGNIHSSVLWEKSSSDPVLMSDGLKQSSSGDLFRLPSSTAHKPLASRDAVGLLNGKDGLLSQTLGSFPAKSARRSEPEGCSAVTPDGAVPVFVSIMNVEPPQASSAVPPQDVTSPTESSVGSVAERATQSDSSSADSLAAKVASLLKKESPAPVVSSRASTADEEEQRAREWIKLKVSGQLCEPLVLNTEDRRCIEEIKKELLRNRIHPTKQLSSDSDSSTCNSSALLRKPPAQPAGFQHQALKRVELSTRCDLEARVREIAQREGVPVPGTSPPPLSSSRRSPSTSPAPRASPTPTPLGLTHPPSQSRELLALTMEDFNLQVPPEADVLAGESEDVALTRGPSKDLMSEPQQETSRVDQARDQRQHEVCSSSEVRSTPEAVGMRRCWDSALWPGPEKRGWQEGRGTDQQDSTLSAASGHLSAPSQRAPFSLGPAKHRPISRSYPDFSSSLSSQEPTAASSGIESPTPASSAGRKVPPPVESDVEPLDDSKHPGPPAEASRLSTCPVSQSSPSPPHGRSVPPTERSAYFPVSGESGRPSQLPVMCPATSSLENRVPLRGPGGESPHPSVQMTSRSPQKPNDLSRPLLIQTPALPVLLPYKPKGSPEFFYMPCREAPSPSRSDTSMESSHPGSDDAVPPVFAVEVLGSRDWRADSGVITRHTEGIYSKRLKGSSPCERGRGPDVSVDSALLTKESQQVNRTAPVFQGTAVLDNLASDVSSKDTNQGPPEPEPSLGHLSFSHTLGEEKFAPLRGEVDNSMEDGSVPPPEREGPVKRGCGQRHNGGSTLDELWQKFNERRSGEGARPAHQLEQSLLERLDRLSRLIHSGRVSGLSRRGREEWPPLQREAERTGRQANRERVERDGEDEGQRRRAKGNGAQQAWAEPSASPSSTLSQLSPSLHHCPAEREDGAQTESGETTSTLSSIDTTRLIRAFGSHRVKGGLGRLYTTIDRQRESGAVNAACSTDDSAASPESVSSHSVESSPSVRGPSHALVARRTVKLVSRGIQAGHLEIVSNGTRKHTRDVGTTFPSPGSDRGARDSPTGSAPNPVTSQRRNRNSRPAHCPQATVGTSWFVPADDLKVQARKENRPTHSLGPVWFQPFTKTKPWREPLKERQVQEEPMSSRGLNQVQPITSTEITSTETTSKAPSAMVRVTLQESLELRRPDFISRSRERMKRLKLHAQERRLQAVFDREREELFNRPGNAQGPCRPPSTLGPPAYHKRAIPRKEMIRRSKEIYSQLPEVQRRREEEKRKAEYHSYRLKAQLYKTKITNRILGRRTPWH